METFLHLAGECSLKASTYHNTPKSFFSTSSSHLSLLLAALLSFKSLICFVFDVEEGKAAGKGHIPRETIIC